MFPTGNFRSNRQIVFFGIRSYHLTHSPYILREMCQACLMSFSSKTKSQQPEAEDRRHTPALQCWALQWQARQSVRCCWTWAHCWRSPRPNSALSIECPQLRRCLASFAQRFRLKRKQQRNNFDVVLPRLLNVVAYQGKQNVMKCVLTRIVLMFACNT